MKTDDWRTSLPRNQELAVIGAKARGHLLGDWKELADFPDYIASVAFCAKCNMSLVAQASPIYKNDPPYHGIAVLLDCVPKRPTCPTCRQKWPEQEKNVT